jgi:hypothetical protein
VLKTIMGSVKDAPAASNTDSGDSSSHRFKPPTGALVPVGVDSSDDTSDDDDTVMTGKGVLLRAVPLPGEKGVLSGAALARCIFFDSPKSMMTSRASRSRCELPLTITFSSFTAATEGAASVARAGEASEGSERGHAQSRWAMLLLCM